jgi:hypothetical protein
MKYTHVRGAYRAKVKVMSLGPLAIYSPTRRGAGSVAEVTFPNDLAVAEDPAPLLRWPVALLEGDLKLANSYALRENGIGQPVAGNLMVALHEGLTSDMLWVPDLDNGATDVALTRQLGRFWAEFEGGRVAGKKCSVPAEVLGAQAVARIDQWKLVNVTTTPVAHSTSTKVGHLLKTDSHTFIHTSNFWRSDEWVIIPDSAKDNVRAKLLYQRRDPAYQGAVIRTCRAFFEGSVIGSKELATRHIALGLSQYDPRSAEVHQGVTLGNVHSARAHELYTLGFGHQLAWFHNWQADVMNRSTFWLNVLGRLLGVLLVATVLFIAGIKGNDLVYGSIFPAENMPGVVVLSVVEEAAKKFHPMVTPMIIAYELHVHGPRASATAVMHSVTALMPIYISIPIHVSWNLVILSMAQPKALPVYPTEDICVDEDTLRDNEAAAPGQGYRVPLDLGKKRLCCTGPRAAVCWAALSVTGVRVDVFRACACNERAAIASRVTAQANKRIEEWRSWWASVPPMPHVVEADYAEWLKHLPSKGRGVLNNVFVDAPLKYYRTAKAFIKREKAAQMVDSYEPKAPRLIQGRSNEHKVAMGPFTWVYGKVMSELWNPQDSMFVYASGHSAEEIGAFIDAHPAQDGYEWIAVDCRRWDSTLGPVPMELLFEEYRSCGAPPHVLQALCDRTGFRFGVTHAGIRYRRRAQVSSGDGDTSCGNSRCHLVLLQSNPAIKAAIVAGDDAVILTNSKDLVMQRYVAGGFKPKLAPEFDFCSSLFWPTADGTVLAPKIGRVLAKTFMNTRDLPLDKQMQWLRGVALGLHNSTFHIPILRVVVARFIQLTTGHKAWFPREHEYKIMAQKPHESCTETLDFVAERYDLSYHEIELMEQEAKTLQIGQVLGDSWRELVSRDL